MQNCYFFHHLSDSFTAIWDGTIPHIIQERCGGRGHVLLFTFAVRVSGTIFGHQWQKYALIQIASSEGLWQDFWECLAFPRALGIILICFTCSVFLKYDQRDQAGNTCNIEYVIGGHLSKLSFSDLLIIAQLFCTPSAAFLTETTSLPKSSSFPFLQTSLKHQQSALGLHYTAWSEFCGSFMCVLEDSVEKKDENIITDRIAVCPAWLSKQGCTGYLNPGVSVFWGIFYFILFFCAELLIMLWLASVCIYFLFFWWKCESRYLLYVPMSHLFVSLRSLHARTPPLWAFQFFHTANGKLKQKH